MNGVDVAVYQGTIDYGLLKQEMDFCISKATEGVGYQDPTFDRNWTETKTAGMIRGAYHFARPDLGNSAEDEATYFLSRLGPLGNTDILGLDYEVSWDGDVVGWCKTWLDKVRAVTGISPLVYLNLSYFHKLPDGSYTLRDDMDWTPIITAGYSLWLADYDGDPTYLPSLPWKVTMKQWTSSGDVSGIQGRVDLNNWFVEDDVATMEEIAKKVLSDAGLDENSVKVLKEHVDYHIHAVDPITKQTTIPLHPPVRNAVFSGGSADFRQIFWIYPDGVLHTWIDGVEVGSTPVPPPPPPGDPQPDNTLVMTTERGWIPKWIAERDHLTITG